MRVRVITHADCYVRSSDCFVNQTERLHRTREHQGRESETVVAFSAKCGERIRPDGSSMARERFSGRDKSVSFICKSRNEQSPWTVDSTGRLFPLRGGLPAANQARVIGPEESHFIERIVGVSRSQTMKYRVCPRVAVSSNPPSSHSSTASPSLQQPKFSRRNNLFYFSRLLSSISQKSRW